VIEHWKKRLAEKEKEIFVPKFTKGRSHSVEQPPLDEEAVDNLLI